jgi:NADH-quinone oxidoreductase subunit N
MKGLISFNMLPALPEMFVLAMACVTLMAGVFLQQKKQLPYYIVQFTLIVTAGLTWFVYQHFDHSQTVTAFYNSFVLDKLAVSLKLFIYITAFFAFMYSHHYNNDRRIPNTEYYVLGLLSVLGMMVLVSGHNFLTLYLGLELMTLPIYAMVALQRAKMRCIEAAMKYFVIGALASGLLLYGLSLLFGVSKSLDIATVANLIANTPISQNLILLMGMVFVLAGVAFKLGAAPFHMWVPDVYDGAPTSTTIFLSSASKIAAFGLLVRLIIETMPQLHLQWQHILIVVSILSMGIGNFVAIVQTSIKRMLAYSSIAHMGYMLLGILCGTARGYSAAMFYMISYAIMTLGAFGIVALISKAGMEANDIKDFAGLNNRNPWLAFLMLILMFSMAGVPPIVGFIAKVGVLEALIQVHMVWLAVVALLFAIVGVYYYIRVVRVMYFEDTESSSEKITIPLAANIAITINSFAVLLLGIFPAALFALCRVTF